MGVVVSIFAHPTDPNVTAKMVASVELEHICENMTIYTQTNI